MRADDFIQELLDRVLTAIEWGYSNTQCWKDIHRQFLSIDWKRLLHARAPLFESIADLDQLLYVDLSISDLDVVVVTKS